MTDGQSSPSWIIIYDNTAHCIIRYTSDTITEVLGWSPKELIGKDVYQFVHRDDMRAIRVVHMSNVLNEKLSSMVSYRLKHKLGHFVRVATAVHYASESLVTCNTIFNPDSLLYKQWANSADECFILEEAIDHDSKLALLTMSGQPFAPMEEHLQRSLHVSKRWADVHQAEPRFYVFLDRFSSVLTVTDMDPMVTPILGGLPPTAYINMSLFQVVHPRDREVVEAQCTAVKSLFVISRVRFDWMIDPENDLHIPVEAVINGTSDCLVMVVRLVPKPVQY
ncbi:hypothetical protein DM01DRAFT_1403088 [Hesseltinella vesiculosa]|uniref:PAS domain-containing protein n=1 Tax=Hesseltinella vesiculosa TaxID=101127 RepID=A0A1X2GX25_9FUNG|nr:hypothetical protein DM01DRAFT_1403088 [Hesseltinella vesiculosa]